MTHFLFGILSIWQHIIYSHIDASSCLSNFAFLFAALAVRDKLESLCRELQRQNKMLMVFSIGLLPVKLIL